MRHVTILVVIVAIVLGIGVWWWSEDTAPPPSIANADANSPGAATATAPMARPPEAELRDAVEASANDPARAAGSEPSPEELWGRVVRADNGDPIADADLTLQLRDADQFWNLDLEYGRHIEEVGRTRSAADGTFRFPVQRATKHKLVVRAAGLATRTLPNLIGGAEVLVEMSPGSTVVGVVRCEGKGLGVFPVRVAVAGESIELASGRTLPDGTFAFPGLQPASVFVQAQSPMHSEKWERLELEPGKTHRAEFDLEGGKAVRGRVVDDATGTPIVDAAVSDSWTFKRVAHTDIDGRFVLRGIADDGFVCIEARARGYASAFHNMTGKLGEAVEFRLVPGGTVTGRIVNEAGQPVAQAYAAVAASYMKARGMQGCDWIRADIGPDGRHIAAGLRPDLHYWLYVRASGYGTRTYVLPRRLASGERHDVGDVVLRRAGGVEGRVVDDTGEPVADVAAGLSGSNDDSRAWFSGQRVDDVSQFRSRGTKTDDRGAFAFTSVSAGEYTITVRLPSQQQSYKHVVTVADGEIAGDVEIVVPRGLTIEGTLVFADRRALGDEAARIYLTAEGVSTPSRKYTSRVDASGHFTFPGVLDGEYSVYTFQPPKGWSLAPKTGVAAGTTDLRLVLEPSAFVAGQVVDENGTGAKMQVYARADGFRGGSLVHTTDDEGRFRLEVPQSFRGTVGAHDAADWSRKAEIENVVAGQTELHLQLRKVTIPGLGR